MAKETPVDDVSEPSEVDSDEQEQQYEEIDKSLKQGKWTDPDLMKQ